MELKKTIQKEVSSQLNNKVKKLSDLINKKLNSIDIYIDEKLKNKENKLSEILKDICIKEKRNGNKNPNEYVSKKLDISYGYFNHLKNGRVKTCSLKMAKNIYKNYGYTVEPYTKEDLL